MNKPIVPISELEKLKELEFKKLIGSSEQEDFDFITSIAAQICDTKIAIINIITENDQWSLSSHGLNNHDIPQDYAFCNHTINNPNEPFIIEDVSKDARFNNRPEVQSKPRVIFYAGISLNTSNDSPLGTLCIIDDIPKKLSEMQLEQLKKLAKQTERLFENRKNKLTLDTLNQELEKKNELLQDTQHANQLGVWELDITTGQTIWSEAVYDIHEVPRDFDHNKVKGIEFYHPDYRSKIINAIVNCISESKSFDEVCQMITAKGRLIWVRSTGRKVGEKLVGSFQDITKIKEQELKFKAIFNSTFAFIGFLNAKGILLEANDTALNMAGLSHEDVIGKYFWDCYWWQISPRTQEELKVNFQKALSGEVIEYEVAVWIANRTPIVILFSLKPIFDDNGKVIYVIPEGRPVQDIIDSRRKYKSVIEGTNVGTWEWNVQTGETVFNERWAEIVGYTLDELAPISIQTWLDLAHPDDLKESERRLNTCFEKKTEYYEFETRMKHKSGHWVWVYDRGKVFEWTEEGMPLMMYGTHQDITDRKQREETLRISEETFRGNFENGAVGMALLDVTGKWLKVNSKVCEIVGYSEEELLKLTFQDITHPEDLNADLELLDELIRGERNHYQMEKRYFHKDGHIVYILLAVSMVKDEDGKVLYFISQLVEVSKRKRAEIELKQLLMEKQALMDATTEVAFFSTTTDGIIVNSNRGVKNILGYKNQEVIGKGIKNLLFLEKEWTEMAQQLLNSQSEEGNNHELLYKLSKDAKLKTKEWTFKKKNGLVIQVLLSVTEVISENKTHGYLFAATDISYLKFVQQQLAQKNDELEQFAYVAAHDLKEPLRGITTYLSVLQKKYSSQLDEKANDYIYNANNSALKMRKLIDDILDFSRTGIIGQKQVNLDKLVDSIFANYKNEDNQNQISLSKSELPTIKGDTSSFIQLFTNLIDNGIKYQQDDSVAEITIDVIEDEKFWIFSIADNGIGIKPEHQERVFEIFKRLHAYSEYKGTGIGLASCKKIVSAYGGKIWFEANEPKGTIFKFTLLKQ